MDTSWLTLVIIQLTSLTTLVYSDCLFQSQCGTQQSAVQIVPVPCIYNGPAKVMNTTGFGESLEGFYDFKPEFQSLCPDVDLSKPVCCSRPQAEGMIEQMSTPRGFLGRCPSCFRNFMQLVCTMTCSPDQVRSLNILELNH